MRDELKSLPQPDTIVCRCEDVTFERLRVCGSWREAKLQTRCGMGPCQWKTCGSAVAAILADEAGIPVPDVPPPSIRAPVRPVRLDELLTVHLDGGTGREPPLD